jgi:hypothetical protein
MPRRRERPTPSEYDLRPRSRSARRRSPDDYQHRALPRNGCSRQPPWRPPPSCSPCQSERLGGRTADERDGRGRGRPPALSRPPPRFCIRGKQQSRSRYRVPCKAGVSSSACSLSRSPGRDSPNIRRSTAPLRDERQAGGGERHHGLCLVATAAVLELPSVGARTRGRRAYAPDAKGLAR